MGTPENEIQREIMDYLDARKIYYVRPQAGGYRGGMNLKCNDGAPDLVVCLPSCGAEYTEDEFEYGQFLGVEIKSHDGKQRPSQKIAQENIERCGGKYIVVRSLEKFMEVIK